MNDPNIITYTPEQTDEIHRRLRRRPLSDLAASSTTGAEAPGTGLLKVTFRRPEDEPPWALTVEFSSGMQYELAEGDTTIWSQTRPWSQLSIQYESAHQRIRISGPRERLIGLLSTYPSLYRSAQTTFAPYSEGPADEAPERAAISETAQRLAPDGNDDVQAIGSTPERTGGPIACTMPEEAG